MVKNGKTPQVLILCPKVAAKPLYMGIRKQKFICKNCRSTRVFTKISKKKRAKKITAKQLVLQAT